MDRRFARTASWAVCILLLIDNIDLLAQGHAQSWRSTQFTGRRGPPRKLGTAHSAKSAASRVAGQTSLPAAVIREPSQGRPIFRRPGETFYFVMKLPSGLKDDVRFNLRHALEPGIRVPLKTQTPPSLDEHVHLLLRIPTKIVPGLYDLEVRTDKAVFDSRRCVKVVEAYKDRFRFVHLSNMNIGDPTAPDFDYMLPKEINLLAPEFIIATGDYTEWAHARDDPSSWLSVLSFFEEFNAPVFMLCGVHDHVASFSDFVASKPIDKIDYGNYHGLLLLDHPGNPIDQDVAQIQWVEHDLKENRNKRMNFLVANSDELGLIDVWRARGVAERFIADYNVRMYIAGGSTDWDYREFADKLQGLTNLQFIRTHQSSTCMRDRATGFSHYRVIEVNGDQLYYVYHDDTAAEQIQHSIPTGRLRPYFDAPNDGTAGRVGVTIQNALNQAFDDARIWLRVAKNRSKNKPTIAPGRVVHVIDAGDYWACEVAYDLPDKGAVRIVASVNPSDVPPPMPVKVELDGPREWRFSPRTTGFGLSYFESNDTVRLKLTNQAKASLSCWPVVRVNGSQLHLDRSVVSRLPLTLSPGQTWSAPLVLNLRRVSPGPHKLQIYFLEDPLSRLHTFDVSLLDEGGASSFVHEPRKSVPNTGERVAGEMQMLPVGE